MVPYILYLLIEAMGGESDELPRPERLDSQSFVAAERAI